MQPKIKTVYRLIALSNKENFLCSYETKKEKPKVRSFRHPMNKSKHPSYIEHLRQLREQEKI
jgi:hypothetical protein